MQVLTGETHDSKSCFSMAPAHPSWLDDNRHQEGKEGT